MNTLNHAVTPGSCCATPPANAAPAAAPHAHHAAHAQPARHAPHANNAHHAPHANNAHHAHHVAGGSRAALTTAATLHCLSGCAIGEFVGLAIGVSFGLGVWPTMLLATALGFASGYLLGLWPLVRRGSSWIEAFRTLWLGETISIAAMEFAMNFTDYHVGGVAVASLLDARFWLGYALALPAGFVVAWPVNYWLLRREIKAPCH